MTDVSTWDIDSPLRDGRFDRPIVMATDPSGTHPVPLVAVVTPLEAEMLVTQGMVALGMPLFFLGGQLLYGTGWLPEIIIGSVLVAFFNGLYQYWRDERLGQTPIGHLRVDEPMYRLAGTFRSYVFLPAILWPLWLASIGVFAVWSEEHFVAIAIPAFACACLVTLYGTMPVVFLKEYFLAFPEIDPKLRYFGDRGESRPSEPILFTVLGLLLFLPLYTSTSFTYVALSVVLALTILLKVQNLKCRDPFRLLHYLVLRTHVLAQIYLDYHDGGRDRIQGSWVPPSTRLDRRFQFKALFAAVSAVLLTSLSYYCAWEAFAWLFVPENRLAEAYSGLEQGKFTWFFAPFAVAKFADPLAGYMLTYLFALFGFIVFPPLLLFALYFDRIVEVEAIYQQILLGRRLIAGRS